MKVDSFVFDRVENPKEPQAKLILQTKLEYH